MPSALQLLWLVPALPLAGFLANGVLALRRPRAKHAVSIIGVGVLLAALALAIVIVLAFLREGTPGPLVFPYWEWMPVGELHVTVALQLDQLSAVMLLVVTGVSSLIHVFSVGYMGEDPGYARYFAYLNLFVFLDRKSTRLNSSHGYISYAVFCLKKKNNHKNRFHTCRSIQL